MASSDDHVLAGKDFGGRHEGALGAGLDGDQQRHHGHDGFA